MFRRSPTVATVLSLTFGCPAVGLDKSTNPLRTGVLPSTVGSL